MQPLGYYGLNFTQATEQAIDNAPIHELTNCLHDIASTINHTHYLNSDLAPEIEEEFLDSPELLTDMERIGLIRALCDRIEIKLMEQLT